MSNETLSVDSWNSLVERMTARAMSGDAAAIRFCEKHKPAPGGEIGDDPRVAKLVADTKLGQPEGGKEREKRERRGKRY